jgi:uncharacterized protein YndB with AHSA1/START domain
MSIATDDHVLHMERLIAAPPERVFQYWTEPELFMRWFGPEGYDIPQYDGDLRPGGRWRTTMRSPEGKVMRVSGVYRAIDPPRRLVFTWAWDGDTGPGHETEVTVLFEPTPGGTRLRLTHQTFESKDSRDNHRFGWTSTLNKLEKLSRAVA